PAAPPSRATPEPTAIGATPTASPLARRAAAIRGIDLAGVSGSGPAGLVRRADVDRLDQRPVVGAPTDAALRVAGDEKAEVLRGATAALVEHMERSREIPTATSFRTIAVDTLDARRRALNAALSST